MKKAGMMLAGTLCAVSLVCGAASMGVFAGSVVGSDDWKGDLKSARRDCEGLGKVVEELEAKGGGQYSRAAYEVVRYSLDAMENFDLPRGQTSWTENVDKCWHEVKERGTEEKGM